MAFPDGAFNPQLSFREIHVRPFESHDLSTPEANVVTREELREAVWAQNTHVDFDRGINKAINRLRQVLGDR